MMPAVRDRLILTLLLIVSGTSFLVGINWGLPSRAVDPFLFGSQQPWDGAKIVQLAGDRSAATDLGADVDRNPVSRGDAPVVLNGTDQQRAEIVRRYRLYTYQPDEMITMMALSSMRPGARDFDPKLYQYGGLWIYPVGALIKVLAHPRADQTYYLDHPEAFARFYLIARLYVVAFAMVGAAAVFWIAKRFSRGNLLVASAATLCYALMPVVVNMAHEAKPHLPAAVLILLACIAATKYVDTGKKTWWVLCGALCGAAAGMVLSAVLAMVVPLVMAVFRREQRMTVLLATLVIAVDVYFLTNPYVLIHLLRDRAVLQSNLQNTQAMYRTPPSVAGIWNALELIGEGTSVLIGCAGAAAVVGFILLQTSKRRTEEIVSPNNATLGWTLAIVSALVLIQFATFGTGKPGEYARFALLPDIALGIVGVVGAARIARSTMTRIILLGMLVIATAFHGVSYDWQFARDSIARSTRIIAAERLRMIQAQGATTLAISAEPAPYSLPPVDLFKWKILLLPRGQTESSSADVSIRTVDSVPDDAVDVWTRPRLAPTPISWAAKPVEVQVRGGASRSR